MDLDPTIPTSYKVGIYDASMRSMSHNGYCRISDDSKYIKCIYKESYDPTIIEWFMNLCDNNFDKLFTNFILDIDYYCPSTIYNKLVMWYNPLMETGLKYISHLVSSVFWSSLDFQFKMAKTIIIHFGYSIYTGAIPLWVCIPLVIVVYVLYVKIAYFILWKSLKMVYWFIKKSCIGFVKFILWSIKSIRHVTYLIYLPFSFIIAVIITFSLKSVINLFSNISSSLKKTFNMFLMGMKYTNYYICKFMTSLVRTSLNILSVLFRLMAVVGCIVICLMTYLALEDNSNTDILMSYILILSIATLSVAGTSVLIVSKIPLFHINRLHLHSKKSNKKRGKNSKKQHNNVPKPVVDKDDIKTDTKTNYKIVRPSVDNPIGTMYCDECKKQETHMFTSTFNGDEESYIINVRCDCYAFKQRAVLQTECIKEC